MIDFLLLPTLLGAAITLALCTIRRRPRQPPFWLALFSAAMTGTAVLLFFYRSSLLTAAFWSGGKAPGWALVVTVFGLSAFASLVASVMVILIYRFCRDEGA
jgi:hypothetical protein